MIQIKRGQTANWRASDNILADGQPGYDRNKNKIKIGNGISTWSNLKYASGLNEEDILLPESKAKTRYLLDPEDSTLITYGPDAPDKDTVGQIYLQQYESAPEVDYVVEYGISGIWTYRKWKSGCIDCWGTYEIETAITEPLAGNTLFCNITTIEALKYPSQITFLETPHEVATLKSAGWVTWLASMAQNTVDKTAVYKIIAPYSTEIAKYSITFNVHGKENLKEG